MKVTRQGPNYVDELVSRVRAFGEARLAEYPAESCRPVAWVLRDIRHAFASEDFEGRDACLRTAWSTLQTVYGRDVIDEDAAD